MYIFNILLLLLDLFLPVAHMPLNPSYSASDTTYWAVPRISPHTLTLTQMSSPSSQAPTYDSPGSLLEFLKQWHGRGGMQCLDWAALRCDSRAVVTFSSTNTLHLLRLFPVPGSLSCCLAGFSWKHFLITLHEFSGADSGKTNLRHMESWDLLVLFQRGHFVSLNTSANACFISIGFFNNYYIYLEERFSHSLKL